MRFAKIVFWCAAVWGFVALIPLYFMFDTIGRQSPPPITHPDYFYGFVGVALAWQVAFVLIASDPVRLRPIMIPSILEKISYFGALVVLRLQGRLNPSYLIFFGCIDLLLCFLFLAAFAHTRASAGSRGFAVDPRSERRDAALPRL